MCLHFRFVLYWHKTVGAKDAHRTLVKLTPFVLFAFLKRKIGNLQSSNSRDSFEGLAHEEGRQNVSKLPHAPIRGSEEDGAGVLNVW